MFKDKCYQIHDVSYAHNAVTVRISTVERVWLYPAFKYITHQVDDISTLPLPLASPHIKGLPPYQYPIFIW